MTTPVNRPLITAVLVSYQSENELPEAIRLLPQWCEVIVVDQHRFGTAGSIATEVRSDVVSIRSGANRGFGAGCNLGAANAQADILLFLNPDARIDEQNLERLMNTCVSSGGGVVGPKILDEAGEDVTRARNWGSPWKDAMSLLIPAKILPPAWAQDVSRTDRRYTDGGAVPYVQGSCFAVGAQLFAEAGGFNERFFLYGEEEYLSRQLVRLGYPTLLEPRAVAWHVGGTSTSKVADFAVEQLFRSRIMLYRETGRSVGLSASLLAVVVLCLLVTTPVRAVVKYRPNEDLPWCAAALRGIRAGCLGTPVRPPE